MLPNPVSQVARERLATVRPDLHAMLDRLHWYETSGNLVAIEIEEMRRLLTYAIEMETLAQFSNKIPLLSLTNTNK